MIKRILFIIILFYSFIYAQQTNNPQQSLNQVNQNFFIANKGQWNPEVKYLARIGGMNAWITNSGVVYDYYRIRKNYDETKTAKMSPQEKRDYENKNTTVEGDLVRMQLVNAEKDVIQVGNNQRQGYQNYFIGNDQSKWASNVPLYDNIELKGIYKNINVKYYYDNRRLRYDYKAKPGSDLSQIKFKFEGQESILVNSNGELVLTTSIGEVTNGKLYAYQMEGGMQKKVECKFEQRQDGLIGLKAAGYDVKKELIIDPLVYSTFIGGNNEDYGYSITVDAIGDAYITGFTKSSNYPTTTGAYQSAFGANSDVFITKLNSTGSDLSYSTFIGGNNADYGNSITIDDNENVYITGGTSSSNYPITSGAYQTTIGGNSDAFITKLNSTGNSLAYSTLIGGNNDDQAYSIVIDAGNNAYITGNTKSSNYPTTSGAYQNTFGGNSDVFVSKFNSNGSALVYSTFIGGNNYDQAYSIALDVNKNTYITGFTYSSDYPITSGSYQTNLSGYDDAFITKLNSTGDALVYSTFIGGSNNDWGVSIATDKNGYAYITGGTMSSNFPSTNGAYQITLDGQQNAYVTKLNLTGSDLIYSTFVGGNGQDQGKSIVVDASGNTYITGLTQSSNYPVTSDAFQTYLGGNSDAFLTRINSTGNDLTYSSFMGGNNADYGNSIKIDVNGNVYITGQTSSLNFPTTNGAYQTNLNSNGDVFVTKLNINTISLPTPFLAFPLKDQTPYTATINSVFDHSMETPYATVRDGIVEAYTGEIGDKKYGVSPDVNGHGYYNSDTSAFIINNHYSGGGNNKFLYYDDHPGYDYKADLGTTVYADADGIVHYPTSFPGIKDAISYHTLEIDHQNGYKTYYLHLSSYPTENNAIVKEGQFVKQGDSVGYSGSAGIVNSPHLHYEIQYNDTAVDPYGWQGDSTDPYTKLTGVVNYKLWLDNPPNNYTTIMDELNSSTLGIATGITYATALSGSGAVFSRANESRISYPFSYGIPKEGTLEWWVNIQTGYWYDNYTLYDNQSSAQLFGSDAHGGDVNWPGMMKLIVSNNSQIQLTTGKAYAQADYHLLTATSSQFKFNQWHSIGISFGSQGQYIMVDGNLVASDPTYTQELGSAGNFSVPIDTPTIGQCISGFWNHDQYDGGFNGIVDRFRASSKQEDWVLASSTITGIGVESINIPKLYNLSQNYPNPFNPTTIIEYDIPKTSEVRLDVFDILGRNIVTLVNDKKAAGSYKVEFNASNLASGVYFYRMQAGSFIQTRKLVLLR